MRDAGLGRREFLKLAALGAAGAAGAAALADCGGTPPKPRPPVVAPATAAQWLRYGASLRGRLVRRGAPGYPVARLLYNPKFDDLYPLAIAYCASPADVAATIGFARSHGYPLAVRCGGHSYGGYSSGDGRLVCDVTEMRSVAPAARPGGTATIGAGARLIDVYNALGTANQLVPGGSCPSVGIAGLALGGGVGVFARQYGLTSDNVAALTVVTADARVLRCDESTNPDLYWACRGGGGGNFAVVTSFEMTTHPMPPVTLFTYDFDWAAAAEVLGAWQHWSRGVNRAVWSNCQLLSGGGMQLRVSGVACAAPAQTQAWVAPLLAAIPASPSYSFLGGEDYLHAMMVEAGCASLTVAACHLTTATPGGVLSRDAFTASSSYVKEPMGSSALAATVAAVDELASQLPGLGGGIAFDALGGAVDDLAPTDTAFVHRGNIAGIQSSFNWGAATPAATIAAGQRWLARVGTSVYEPANGAYQNYIDPTLADWRTAYYGENLPRLEQLKRRFDPDGVFSFAQSIPEAPLSG